MTLAIAEVELPGSPRTVRGRWRATCRLPA
jgi:hypothetical protein